MIQFEEIINQIYSEDDFDYSTVESKHQTKTCLACRKEFIPNGRNASRQNYCNRTHYLNCVICGKPVKQVPPSIRYGTVKATCSKECNKKFKAQQTFDAIKDKYGYENISQVPEFKEKISAAIKEKSEETTKKVVATMKERYGGIGTASPTIRAKIEKTVQERYGVTNAAQNDDVKRKISEALRQRNV